MGYANFFIRLGAFIIDGVILTGLMMPVYFLTYAAQRRGGNIGPLAVLIYLGASWLYFALQESSQAQATIGKRICAIKVTDFAGKRLTFGNATGRYFAKCLSALIYGIGFIVALFTQKNQAMHDKMADTYVVTRDTDQSFFAAEGTQFIQDGIEKKIKQLLDLKSQGILSESEFNEAKAKLLARV